MVSKQPSDIQNGRKMGRQTVGEKWQLLEPFDGTVPVFVIVIVVASG
jgi:hypothetical protein